MAVNPEWFLIGEVDGEIIASCMTGYDGHRGAINYLAVVPSQQRLGLARKIMTAAANLLREAGCPKINLRVRSTNAKVIEFYREIGFAENDVVSLGKRLAEPDKPL